MFTYKSSISMETVSTITPVQEELRRMISDGRETDQIKQYLLSTGISEQSAAEMISLEKSENLKRRRKRGFILGVTGSILLVFGFLLTVILFHSGISIEYAMYGLTSAGALLLMAGLVDVIGW